MGSPALLDAQAERLLPRHNALMQYLACHAVGGVATDGGTTQATGAAGALNFDVDLTAIVEAIVDGEVHVLDAQTDADAAAGAAVAWSATSGEAVVAAVVLETGSGNDTPAIETVFGTVADTGEQTAPTDADIDEAVGHTNWTRLSDVTITRTGDVAVTFVADNAARYPSEIRGAHRVDLAETEAEFRESSDTMP